MDRDIELFCHWRKAVTENDFLFSGGIVAEFSPYRGTHCQVQVHGNAIVLRSQDGHGAGAVGYTVIGGYSSEARCFWLHDLTWDHPGVTHPEQCAFKDEMPFLFASGGPSPVVFSNHLLITMRQYIQCHNPAGNVAGVTAWDNGEKRREHTEDGLPLLTSGKCRLTTTCRMELLQKEDGNLSLTEIQKRNFVWRLEECFNFFSETDDSDNEFRFGGQHVIEEVLKHGPRWFENDGGVCFEFWENILPPIVLELREDGTKPEGYIVPDGRVVSIGIGRMFLPEISRFLTGGGPFGNPPEWADLVQAFAITNAFRSY